MQHRTALVTAASVVIVVVAGSAAIAANLGILNSAAAAENVGELTVSAAAAPEVPPARVVRVADPDAPAPTTTTTQPAPASDTVAYAVDDAGVVTLQRDGTLLSIARVDTNLGWEWVPLREGRLVEIGFVGPGRRVLQFLAAVDRDGAVQTRLDDLTVAAPARGDGEREGREREREGRQDDD